MQNTWPIIFKASVLWITSHIPAYSVHSWHPVKCESDCISAANLMHISSSHYQSVQPKHRSMPNELDWVFKNVYNLNKNAPRQCSREKKWMATFKKQFRGNMNYNRRDKQFILPWQRCPDSKSNHELKKGVACEALKIIRKLNCIMSERWRDRVDWGSSCSFNILQSNVWFLRTNFFYVDIHSPLSQVSFQNVNISSWFIAKFSLWPKLQSIKAIWGCSYSAFHSK